MELLGIHRSFVAPALNNLLVSNFFKNLFIANGFFIVENNVCNSDPNSVVRSTGLLYLSKSTSNGPNIYLSTSKSTAEKKLLKNIKAWAYHNKMTINFSKTKEIVFHRPNPCHSVNPLPVDDIEQLTEARVLGVILNGNFCFDSHIQFVMRICSQRLHIIKLLRKQALPHEQLCIVF
jgi:hypothetical protein